MKKFLFLSIFLFSQFFSQVDLLAADNAPENNQLKGYKKKKLLDVPQVRVLIAKEKKGKFFLKKNNFEIDENFLYLFDTKYNHDENRVIDFEIDKQKQISINGHKYTGKFRIIKERNHFKIINELSLEDYLAGVLSSEISYSWSESAIRAQAIAARTYAYYLYQKKIDKDYNIEATVKHQVFHGNFKVHSKITKNIFKTRGIVITYNGEVFQTFFHASCGGMTTTPKDVWGGESLGCYRYEKCDYCKSHPKYKWNYFLKNNFVKKYQIERISIRKRDTSLRVTKMFFITPKKKIELSGKDIRELTGSTDFLSTRFNFYKKRKQFIFIGTGYGHGIGLCQWGAKVMAEKGFSADDILKKYYHGIQFRKIY